jgi:succinate dehydrogenase / fumarate reductase cytochrome b subunit
MIKGTDAATLAPGVVSRFWLITVGKKVLMAVSGFMLVGFVTGHMIGNLQLFMGQEQLNLYAKKLQDLGPLLWTIRAFLLAWLILHLWNGIQLYFQNRSARPDGYQHGNHVQATLSSRVMIWTGLAIVAFATYHLLHFTFLATNPGYRDLMWQGHRDVYSMVVLGFQNPLISGVYIVAMLLLMLHLRRAAQSMFQPMGWNSAEIRPKLDAAATIYSWLVFLGYISMPIAVLAGFVTLPMGVN